MKSPKILTVAFAVLALSSGAFAAECKTDVEDAFDLEAAEINDIYACISAKMLEGYTKGGNEIAAAYRDWSPTATRPAVAGPHGNRLLNTFANDIAAEQYLKFEDEGVVMPAGSVLAKESIKINTKKGKAVVGPLFIMTKGDAGAAPDANDWIYSAVQPNGKPMKIKQSFCHNCHEAYADQGDLGYPLEEVRITN
ncbi:MAG: cytochrome P460 family protein [Pseudomonadota bacterium]